MVTTNDQPTLTERYAEHEILLEVFKMFSWGGLEIYFDPPRGPDLGTGTLWLQATAMPPEEADKPAAERHTTVTAIAFDVHYGPPPIVGENGHA